MNCSVYNMSESFLQLKDMYSYCLFYSANSQKPKRYLVHYHIWQRQAPSLHIWEAGTNECLAHFAEKWLWINWSTPCCSSTTISGLFWQPFCAYGKENCLIHSRTMYLTPCAVVTAQTHYPNVMICIVLLVCVCVCLSFHLSVHTLTLLILFPIKTLLFRVQLPFSRQ